MENKFYFFLGGQAQAVETTGWNQTEHILNYVGLDTPRQDHAGLLDQRSIDETN